MNSPDIRTLHYRIPISHLSLLSSQTNSLFVGTQGTTIASLFPLSSNHYENRELEDHLDTELSFSRYPQQKHHNKRISKAPVATQTHSA